MNGYFYFGKRVFPQLDKASHVMFVLLFLNWYLVKSETAPVTVDSVHNILCEVMCNETLKGCPDPCLSHIIEKISNAPENLTVQWQDQNMIQLRWSVSNANDSSPHIFTVTLKEPANRTLIKLQTPLTELTIGQLDPWHDYMVEVKSIGKSAMAFLVAKGYNDRNPVLFLIYTISPVLIFLLVAVAVITYNLRQRSLHKSELNRCRPSFSADVPDHLLPFLIPPHKVELLEFLGEGAFGVVHKCIFTRGKDKEVVAVKVLPSATFSKTWLLREVDLLQMIGRHPHIVGLIGFSLDVDSMYFLLEYCPFGDLHTQLVTLKNKYESLRAYVLEKGKENCQSIIKNVTLPDGPNQLGGNAKKLVCRLLSYIKQVAIAMEFISSLKIVHRDLASRNVLILNESTVKLGDFGLSRDIYVDRRYMMAGRNLRVPLRWMAPESLQRLHFDHQTDVWSFGVLVWEVFTMGETPYAGLVNNNYNILPFLKRGGRLKRPIHCSDDWYNLMSRCWHSNPKSRPHFRQLRENTTQLFEDHVSQDYTHLV